MGFLQHLVQGLGRSKFRKSLALRPLTSKRANRRFYKGKGCRTEGRHTRKGELIRMLDPYYGIEKILLRRWIRDGSKQNAVLRGS